jgi:hydrogenase expression/formation protein HypC
MCLGIPGRVVEMVDPEHGIAKPDVNGVKRNVSVQLLQGEGGVEVGDWVLIHVGFALAVIDEREAEATLRMLGGAPEVLQDEIAALEQSAID